jgi:hypothetical protein
MSDFSIAKISDYKVFNKNPYLLSQFLSSNLVGFLEASDDQWNALETVFYDVLTQTTLANAVGQQLDNIGVELSLSRGGLSDSAYRAALSAQASLLFATGVTETLYTLLRDLLGCTGVIIGFYFPAKLWVLQSSGYTDEEILTYIEWAIPAGVGLAIQDEIIDNNDNILEDNNGNIIVASMWQSFT